jgi:predicted amidohydrolase YtcJ
MAGAGTLSARVIAAMWWDRHRGMEQVDELIERRQAASGGRLHATSVKIMQDGISENFTAGMLEPYLEPQGRSGLSFLDPPHLNEVVARLDHEGFQVHVHAIGDRAVREALDAFETARAANGPNDHRHHIAHLQVIHPDDVPRFAALNVTANAQPYWACLDDQMQDLVIPFLGPERVGHQYPFRSLRAAGGRLGMGSDWPVSTPDVMKEVQVAVTRVPYDEPGREPYLPEERLSLAQALEAFTAGSAFVNHLDHETGTLDEGMLADLTVLDRDPFELPPEEIATARVVMTLVEGEPVFQDGRALRS